MLLIWRCLILKVGIAFNLGTLGLGWVNIIGEHKCSLHLLSLLLLSSFNIFNECTCVFVLIYNFIFTQLRLVLLLLKLLVLLPVLPVLAELDAVTDKSQWSAVLGKAMDYGLWAMYVDADAMYLP